MTEYSVRVERRFLAAGPISPKWIERAYNALDGRQHEIYFGTISFTSVTRRLEFASYEEWHAALVREADAVIESTLSTSAFLLNPDHRRGVVTITLRMSNEDEADAKFAQLAEMLSLKAVAGDPYRYRRSAATYKIGSFERDKLAEGLARIILNVAKRTNPTVREAYVTFVEREKIESLSGFQDVPPFIEYLKTTKADLRQVGLGFEGPDGVGVGLNINVTDKLLTVRTSKEPYQIPELISPLEEPLALSLIESRQGGSSNAPGTAPAEPWWVKHAISFATLLLATSGIVGAALTELGRAFWTGFDLQIAQPLLENNVAQAAGTQVVVEWYLRPQNGLLRRIDYHPDATVIVIPHENPAARIEEIRRSPATLDLKPGRYSVEIRPVRNANPVQFSLTVPTKTP